MKILYIIIYMNIILFIYITITTFKKINKYNIISLKFRKNINIISLLLSIIIVI